MVLFSAKIKIMRLIVILDDNNGMKFGRRRQSRDSLLIEHMSKLVGEKPIWMNSFSGRLFAKSMQRTVISDFFLDACGDNDYCLCETKQIGSSAEKIRELIVYKWNRVYPSDLKFDLPLENFFLKNSEEFAGSSHDKITVEYYERI